MGHKQDYLSRVNRDAERIVSATRMVTIQMCLDAAMIAANEVFHMGPSRTPAFAAAFSESLQNIAAMTIADTKDIEYTKAKVDDRLRAICGDSFEPWDVRYG